MISIQSIQEPQYVDHRMLEHQMQAISDNGTLLVCGKYQLPSFFVLVWVVQWLEMTNRQTCWPQDAGNLNIWVWCKLLEIIGWYLFVKHIHYHQPPILLMQKIWPRYHWMMQQLFILRWINWFLQNASQNFSQPMISLFAFSKVYFL